MYAVYQTVDPFVQAIEVIMTVERRLRRIIYPFRLKKIYYAPFDVCEPVPGTHLIWIGAALVDGDSYRVAVNPSTLQYSFTLMYQIAGDKWRSDATFTNRTGYERAKFVRTCDAIFNPNRPVVPPCPWPTKHLDGPPRRHRFVKD